MLWVTSTERIVTKTSRPISTGRQTLTNASSPMKPRSPHRERRPRVACAAAADRDAIAGPGAAADVGPPAGELEARARSSVSSPAANDLLAADRAVRADRDAVLEHDPRRDDDGAGTERDVRADARRRARGRRRPSRPRRAPRTLPGLPRRSRGTPVDHAELARPGRTRPAASRSRSRARRRARRPRPRPRGRRREEAPRRPRP